MTRKTFKTKDRDTDFRIAAPGLFLCPLHSRESLRLVSGQMKTTVWSAVQNAGLWSDITGAYHSKESTGLWCQQSSSQKMRYQQLVVSSAQGKRNQLTNTDINRKETNRWLLSSIAVTVGFEWSNKVRNHAINKQQYKLTTHKPRIKSIWNN